MELSPEKTDFTLYSVLYLMKTWLCSSRLDFGLQLAGFQPCRVDLSISVFFNVTDYGRHVVKNSNNRLDTFYHCNCGECMRHSNLYVKLLTVIF